MVKKPAYVESSDISTKPSQAYGWADGAPVRIGATDDALKVSQSGVSTEQTLASVLVLIDGLTIAIRRLIDANILPPDMDMASYRKKVTAVLESGTVTTVSTVSSITNVAGVGGYQPQDMVLGANLTAWALCCRERIT